MKHIYGIIILLLISTYGCNEVEESVIIEDEITSTSRSIDNFTYICEACNAFNDAYPSYQSILAQGLEDYNLNDGCCEECFIKDVSKAWSEVFSVQDRHFIIMFESMERNGGRLVHPDCEAFTLIPRLEDALDRTLIKYQNVVHSVMINPNKSRCENPGTGNSDDDDIPGGGGEVILFDLDAYNFALEERSESLVASIGGDVEQGWLSGGHDLNLLKICYALNQKSEINPYREEIDGNIGYMYGDYDHPYIVNYVFLYRYLCSFVTPELLTLEELEMKEEVGIVIAKESVENDFDVLEGYGDVWDGQYFMSDNETVSAEFYFFEIN